MTSPPPGAALRGALPTVDELYRRHGRMVLRRVARFYGGTEAEDVVQEVFEQVLLARDRFRGDAKVTTWLYQLTTRHCLIRLRNSRRRAELFEQHGAPAWSRTVQLPDAEAVTFLNQLWRTVDPELAEIGVYYYVDGMHQSEIGDLLGVTGRTISNRLASLAEQARALEAP